MAGEHVGAGSAAPAAVGAMAALLLVAACDEGPKGRPLNYEPGVYKGETDQPLDNATLDALRERATRQQAEFGAAPSGRMQPLAREPQSLPLSPEATASGPGKGQDQAESDGQGQGEPTAGAAAQEPASPQSTGGGSQSAGKPRLSLSEEELRERARRQSFQ